MRGTPRVEVQGRFDYEHEHEHEHDYEHEHEHEHEYEYEYRFAEYESETNTKKVADAGSDGGNAVAKPEQRPRRALSGEGWTAEGNGCESPRWYAVVSSRLGRPVEKRQRWFDWLRRVVARAVVDDAALLVVEGTAAEGWVMRAAELFGARTVRIHVADPEDRDRALVQLADRLFVLRVRRGGRIEGLVAERIARDPASVFVAIDDAPDDAGARLLRRGAVGWWLADPAVDEPSLHSAPKNLPHEDLPAEFLPRDAGSSAEDPMAGDGSAWLVHCTRARSGRWAWQSETQWRDEVLLGGEGGRAMAAVEVLERILRKGWLRGAASVTSTAPVVCFSAVPLAQLLARRTYRPHLGRWDYEPFGVAIRRRRIESLGGRPVVYGDSFEATGLPEEERWRFQARGRTFDWRAEQEWRVAGSLDLTTIDRPDAVVFVDNSRSAYRIASHSRWPIHVVGGVTVKSAATR